MSDREQELFDEKWLSKVEKDYRKLISVGIEAAQAEKLVVEHYISRGSITAANEGLLWLALALVQWRLGRLTPETKHVALEWAQKLAPRIEENAYGAFVGTLDSHMPKYAKIPRLRAKHCPWKQGDLLAYRIQSNPRQQNSDFWMQYVLLCVIKIVRWPITELAPDKCYNESMLVGMYNWHGTTIPNPSIAANLEFTPLVLKEAVLSKQHFPKDTFQHCADPTAELAVEMVNRLTSTRIETCFSLSWDKASVNNGTITHIGFDSTFSANPAFFQSELTSYSMGGVHAFDNVVCNRLSQLHK